MVGWVLDGTKSNFWKRKEEVSLPNSSSSVFRIVNVCSTGPQIVYASDGCMSFAHSCK